MSHRTIECGKLVASAISGTWRELPPPITATEEDLQRIRPNILYSGAAGLAWWKLRSSSLRSSNFALEMRNVFRFYAASALADDSRLASFMDLLHRNQIEPILAKGWAVARDYPHRALRPYGDFDFCVGLGDKARILALMQGHKRDIDLDLHEGFRELESNYAELIKRSIRVPVGDSYVCVLAPEDHLRLLCIHTLYHGVWKPGWLCDVALAVESSGAAFDWDRCLAGARPRTDWVLATIVLAHRILGAALPAALRHLENRELPRWIYDAVFGQWGTTTYYMRGPRAWELLTNGGIWETIRSRWPNAIQATVRLKRGVGRGPRLPYKVAHVIHRTTRMLMSLRANG